MNKRIAILVILSAVLAGCGMVQGAFSFYITDAEYQDMDEVHADNAIVRGWIPKYLPGTAHTIRERHSADTNEGWGTFAFREWDREALKAHWREVPAAPFPRDLNRFSEAPKVDWWPDGFGDGFVYFSGVEDRGFWLAVDFANNVGYFWHDG